MKKTNVSNQNQFTPQTTNKQSDQFFKKSSTHIPIKKPSIKFTKNTLWFYFHMNCIFVNIFFPYWNKT